MEDKCRKSDARNSKAKTYDSRGFALQHDASDQDIATRHKDENKTIEESARLIDKDTNDIMKKMQSDMKKMAKQTGGQNEKGKKVSYDVPKPKRADKSNHRGATREDIGVPGAILDNCYKMYETNKNLKTKVEQLKDQINTKTAETETKKLESDRRQSTHEMLLEENNHLKLKIKALEKQIIDIKSDHSDVAMQGLNDIHLKTENELLRRDMRRLLDMLKNTTEYASFANMYDREHNIRYLHHLSNTHEGQAFKANKDTKAMRKTSSIDATACKNLLDVYLDEFKLKSMNDNIAFTVDAKPMDNGAARWVPEECYNFMKGIQQQTQLSDALIEYILYELNCRWQERERDIVKFYKKHGKAHKKELSSAKLPQDEKDRFISQLKKENFDLRTKLKAAKNSSKGSLQFEKMKETAMLEKELKQYQLRNSTCRRLTSKAKLLEKINKYLADMLKNDKLAKYYKAEGANEESKKIERIMSRIRNDIMQLLENNLNDTAMSGATDNDDIKLSYLKNSVERKLGSLERTLVEDRVKNTEKMDPVVGSIKRWS